MTTPSDWEITQYGKTLAARAERLASLMDISQRLYDCRATLARDQAGLQAMLGTETPKPDEMECRLHLVWRQVSEANNAVDAAIVMLYAPLNETPNVNPKRLKDEAP